MKKHSLLIISIIFSLLFLSGCSELFGELPYKNINNEELSQLKAQGVTIYDIRRPEEWRQTGIVDGSKTLTAFDANGRLTNNFMPMFTGEIAKDQPVILICRTGNRTSHLARYLGEELGYSNIYNVKNGITSWIRDKQPTEKWIN